MLRNVHSCDLAVTCEALEGYQWTEVGQVLRQLLLREYFRLLWIGPIAHVRALELIRITHRDDVLLIVRILHYSGAVVALELQLVQLVPGEERHLHCFLVLAVTGWAATGLRQPLIDASEAVPFLAGVALLGFIHDRQADRAYEVVFKICVHAIVRSVLAWLQDEPIRLLLFRWP